ncbi:2-phospho-L-lactate transferase [Natronobacterium gregoryi]|uniref:2-phospho-L-lactate transferase n=2 Tax=Natronobacterium gregoryi TaxID=44930 RepID=L0AEU5_NATGS|nr:2-phospho-L-lactate transferase [Natronobacterium gregoryi]AFZ71580.1 LPPG:FO 2-phospho-L-lactate transferase [Natronobacterium gregoryi SP2]ELY66637.1 LPPG:FO 2-phospho-L-lactate transferase [Natronobacterium gregoryi SP2]PLK21349.1 2-phospho-L-lactate transferase [Natronobacterium gregoryi SP2]SFI81260.1 LPPG:FO 2-phospho-L-lactate transferase [Natronobacterium gregoryi]
MVTFLSGGTGTPKLLDGAGAVFSPEETTIVANTGDDIEIGGLFVSPDVDTLLFQGGGLLDRETWWGIEDDTHRTNAALLDLADAADLPAGPQYLPDEKQTEGRRLANWRRFSGVAEFMTIGDQDRALHITRTSLLDQGDTLSEATQRLADAFDLSVELLPMSDDPVASLIHTTEGTMHFQEYWVGHRGEPGVETVEFRGSSSAEPAPGVLEALSDTVVIGPSNPVTSIGPMLSLPGVPDALARTTVVAVSPFLGDDAFSGPAGELMESVDAEPSTAGLATAYPFADAYVIDSDDDATFDEPTITTDIRIDDPEDAKRVVRAIEEAITLVE